MISVPHGAPDRCRSPRGCRIYQAKVKTPLRIISTTAEGLAELRRISSSLRMVLSSAHVCASVSHAWSRCLTGRIFGLTVWATFAVAVLVAPPAPLRIDISTADISFSPGHERILHTQAFSASESGISFAMDDVPQGAVYASCEDIEMLSDCWAASRMQVQGAWQAAGPLETVLVAVLDTGIDADNTRLSVRIEDNVTLIDNSGTADVCGHGTHMAGTITTIAPNSRLLSIKVADDRGFCDAKHVAEGIRLAANRGAAVINLSLQVEPSPELEAAVEYAWKKGAVLVAAAGMPLSATSTFQASGEAPVSTDAPCRPTMSPPVYPASYRYVIAVTGTNEADALAPVSNRASWVDVAAPGHRTFSDMPGGERGYLTGTSTAAAHVSGVAALLCGIARDTSGNGFVNDEVRYALESSASPLAVDGTGSGIVNALAAVQALNHALSGPAPYRP